MESLTFTVGGIMAGFGTSPDTYNPTYDKPTKNAVIGMIAAALGIRRDETQRLNDLYSKFQVKVKNLTPEEPVFTEFQTIEISSRQKQIVHRQHLEDCRFQITVIGDGAKDLKYALTHPKFQLYLGRKACPFDRPIKFD